MINPKTEEQEKEIDEDEVYEPGSIEEVLSYLKRNFNALNENSIQVRKQAVVNIFDKICQEKLRVNGVISQQIMLKFNKQLLQCFSDKTEKCREYAIKIIKELITKCDDISVFLPYIISVLIERVNCHDLEGILNLPEVMRPPPGQKPKQLIKLVEESEELRLELCNLVHSIISVANSDQLYDHLDDMTNILRCLAMDPFYEIQKQACQTISLFCKNNTELLLHFTELLARGLLLPIISKKSKVRIAALEALTQVLNCGVWKYNAFVFEILIGFRDPNSVPIKDFYEPSHNINYFATFIVDPNIQVREYFLKCCGIWASKLPDRYDHHSRIIPYLLSGLFDEYDEIQKLSYEILEELGQLEEKEKEQEFRDNKQYSLDAEWTWDGKLIGLPLPKPFLKRPCFGARMLVRSHVRKFWHALYKEIKDPAIESQVRSSNLFLMSVIYSEDYMTQYLDQFIPNLIWYCCSKNKQQEPIAEKISKTFELIGRFCPWSTYLPIISSGIKGELSQSEDYIKCSIKAMACIVKGSLDAIPEDQLFPEKKLNFILSVVDIINSPEIINSLQSYNSNEAALLLQNIINPLLKRTSKQQFIDLTQKFIQKMIKLAYIVLYTSTLDIQLILNLSYNQGVYQDLSIKIESHPLLALIHQIYSQLDNSRVVQQQIFDEQIEQKNSIGFTHNSWKILVSQLLYFIYFKGELSQIQEHFNECLTIMTSSDLPEVNDFMAKLSLLFTQYIQKNYQMNKNDNNKALYYTLLIRNNINIIGNVIYWAQNTEKKLNQKIVDNFLVIMSAFGNEVFSSEIKNLIKQAINNECYQGIAKLLYAIPKIHMKYYRSKPDTIVQVVHALITNISSELVDKTQFVKLRVKKTVKNVQESMPPKNDEQKNTQNQEKSKESPETVQQSSNEHSEKQTQSNQEENLKAKQKEEEKKQIKNNEDENDEEFGIPIILEFIIKRIEQLESSANQKLCEMCFTSLSHLADLIPSANIEYFMGREDIIIDYPKFLNKLIKYGVDEKDVELKQWYVKILQKLSQRTPYNFKMEVETADLHKQFARLEFLNKVLDWKFKQQKDD